jgi:hypothetical protein
MPAQPDHIDPHEQRVAALLADVRAQVRAPAALRARIEAQKPSPRVARTRRTVYSGALASGLAVLALALILILPGGAPGAPSLSQAAALGALHPTEAAPPADRDDPANKLDRNVEKIYFPNWTELHWRAVGQRVDRIDGRLARTVYYRWRGRTIAYTIVGAPALATPRAAAQSLNGVTFKTLTESGRLIVTWRRAGHTCILSATDVSGVVMRSLASSHARA